MSFPELELVYFNMNGRGKPIRLILAIGGVPFKDTRVSPAEYGEMLSAGALPLETLPILKVNGKLMSSQSGAILRYAAALAGLELKGGPTAVVRGEEVMGTLGDIAALWVTWFRSSGEEKNTNAQQLIESGFPHYAKRIEAVLREGQHESAFINESLSWVDVFTYCIASYVDEAAKSIDRESPVGQFPKIAALVAAVGALPAVAAYE